MILEWLLNVYKLQNTKYKQILILNRSNVFKSYVNVI